MLPHGSNVDIAETRKVLLGRRDGAQGLLTLLLTSGEAMTSEALCAILAGQYFENGDLASTAAEPPRRQG
jgi:hypothetical protein